ncbi:MAG: tetratricopeptide repeat-containing sensor histidine kinase [Bacteroidetes bacterium]|nr:tetratricopeptide repeat-containing sensor histidine kinase [Bacteroidota bacterium]
MIKSKIDSLENILFNSLIYNLSSTEKTDICIALADHYTHINYEKTVEFAARSMILAEEMGDSEYITESLNLLTKAYFKLDNYDKSIEYATRLYNIHNTNNEELEAGKALKQVASSYYGLSKFIEAKNYYNRALDIFKKHQYFEGIAQTLGEIARILGHWGEYDEALSKHQEALKFYEEIGDDVGIAEAYTGMGMIYEELGNHENAFDHYRKSLEIYEDLGQTYDIVNLTLHIGDIYLQKKLFDKALEYYFKADEIGREINNKKLKAIALSNIGEAYNLKGDYLKALDYQQRSLTLKEEIGDKMRLAITYTEMGLIYSNVEEYDKSLDYLYKGLRMAEELNFIYQINKSHKSLSEVYEKIGNEKLALENYKQYIEGRDRIFTEESKQTIAELQAKYQLERKEKENERLRHSQQLIGARVKNQQLMIGFVLFILLGSFVLSLILHGRYQQNQKLNIQLSLKNKQVEEQRKNMVSLNAELKDANNTKDKFFSIVAHDLKNPFNSLLMLSRLLLDDYDSFTNEERKQFISQINSSAENTYSLLENLLDWARTQSGKSEIIKEKINLSRLSEEAIKVLQPVARGKKITISSDVPTHLTAFADRNMIATVFLNLVSNAVKFTPQKGTIEVLACEKNNHIEVEINDSGVGISDKNIPKLFKPDEKFYTEGTEKEKGTGLGLILCKEFIEKNEGEIWVESQEGAGSQFCFSLPKS